MYDDKRNTDNAADLFHVADLDGSIRPSAPVAPSTACDTGASAFSEEPIFHVTPSATNDMMQTRRMGDTMPPMGTVPPSSGAPTSSPIPPRGTMSMSGSVSSPMHTTPPPGGTMPPRGTTPPPSGAHFAPHQSRDSGKALLQIQIYTRKFWRTLKKESLISILIGIVITLLVMFVTHDGMFENYESTKSGMFAVICVCVWLGIFNSIQLVCREKNDIVKDELDKSLHATSYMAAHFIYQAVLCAIQSFLVCIIFMLFVDEKGNPLLYFLITYMVMFASDAMAFVLSSAVPNPIVAMTFMPLLLLVQLIMAGVMFPLEGFSNALSYFTISRWGMSSLGLVGDIASLPSKMNTEIDLPGFSYDPIEASATDEAMYVGGGGDIALCLFMFFVFIVAFYFLSVLALKLTTRRIKK